MNTPSLAEDVFGHGSGAPDPGPRERFAKPSVQGQGGRRLALVFLLMAALACMLWLAYHLMRANARTDPGPRPEPAVSAVSSIRLQALPTPEPVKEVPKDDKYAQLMAYLSEKFAAYDRLLNRPPPVAPRPPDPASVIYALNALNGNTGNTGAAPQRLGEGAALPLALGELDGAAAGQSGSGMSDLQSAQLAAAAHGLPMPQSSRGVDDMLKPSVLQGERAAKMSNRSFLLAQGTSLECVLETAIDTTVPGLTTCILSRDVYSDDSRVLLLEKGSKLVGEYRGALRNGDERLFLIWSRVVTPLGVAIRLNSPGTDVLGRAGVNGYVDNRYFERFGTALLVSILADSVPRVVDAASNKILHTAGLDDGSSGGYGSTATQSAGNQMGAEIVRQGAIVPPVLRKNQGDKVSILVSRDLDFSSIYALALKR